MLVKLHNTIIRFIFILYEPNYKQSNSYVRFLHFHLHEISDTKIQEKKKKRFPEMVSIGGKKKIYDLFNKEEKKFGRRGFNVFFASKHVSEAAIFKLCVRKRDILTRFPQLSLDFSTTLDTNNNCTRYIRSTYSPHSVFRYE